MDLEVVRTAAGYLFSVLIGHFLTVEALRPMRPRTDQLDPLQPDRSWHNGAVGIVERTIYTSAILLDHPEFAAVWLAFKTASSLNLWKDKRSAFNLWLVGSGLSVSFGVAGGLLAANGPAGNDPSTWLWWPVLVSLALWVLIVLSYRGPFQGWLRGEYELPRLTQSRTTKEIEPQEPPASNG